VSLALWAVALVTLPAFAIYKLVYLFTGDDNPALFDPVRPWEICDQVTSTPRELFAFTGACGRTD
jgi:hypothetical protein